MQLSPPMASTAVCSKVVGSVVVDSLFIVAPIVCVFLGWSLFLFAVLSVLFSFEIITMRKRELAPRL